MAEMVDVVGIEYYVDDQISFLKNLPKGTILTLVKEPENYHDTNAVAVYQDAKMVGHITKGDTDLAKTIFGDKEEKVYIRYTGEYSDSSFSLNLDQKIKVTPYKEIKYNNPFGDLSPLPYKLTPLVLEEERNIIYLADKIDADTRILIFRIPSDSVAIAVAKELTQLLDEYLELADFSLSIECFTAITNIYHRLNSLMMIPEYKKLYKSQLDVITAKRNAFIHKTGLGTIFQRQMTLMTSRLKEHDFFEDFVCERFSNIDCPDHDEVTRAIEDIHNWMAYIPGKAAKYRVTDPHRFVNAVYDAGLSYMNLYMLYASIIVLNFCKPLLDNWVDKGIPCTRDKRHEIIIKIMSDISVIEKIRLM